MIIIKKIQSPIGTLSLASDGIALVGLWLEGQKYFEASIEGEERILFEHLQGNGTEDSMTCDAKFDDSIAKEVFCSTENWLERYFAGEQPDPAELRLAPKGSDFRQSVWKRLLEIPYGETVTYGQIADELNRESDTRPSKSKNAAQAVGGAVGHNPISIIIPCHRVIGADGSLTGYAGGIDKKEFLLSLEGAL